MGIIEDSNVTITHPGIVSEMLDTPGIPQYIHSVLSEKQDGKQNATVNISSPGLLIYDEKKDVRLFTRGRNRRDLREMETAHPLENQGHPTPFRGNPGKTACDLPESAHPATQGP